MTATSLSSRSKAKAFLQRCERRAVPGRDPNRQIGWWLDGTLVAEGMSYKDKYGNLISSIVGVEGTEGRSIGLYGQDALDLWHY